MVCLRRSTSMLIGDKARLSDFFVLSSGIYYKFDYIEHGVCHIFCHVRDSHFSPRGCLQYASCGQSSVVEYVAKYLFANDD